MIYKIFLLLSTNSRTSHRVFHLVHIYLGILHGTTFLNSSSLFPIHRMSSRSESTNDLKSSHSLTISATTNCEVCAAHATLIIDSPRSITVTFKLFPTYETLKMVNVSTIFKSRLTNFSPVQFFLDFHL